MTLDLTALYPHIQDMAYAFLAHRGVVRVSGEDAAAFLQGLITNDIHKAKGDRAIFAALLTPQGKFLHDFFILQQGDGYLLEVEKESIADLTRRLTLYKLRSKVVIENVSEDYKVAALWGEDLRPGFAHGFNDTRHMLLGMRALVPVAHQASFMESMGEPEVLAAQYDLHRLVLGIPEGAKDLIAERSLLLEYGYDQLHAVDFGKGCYVGQEVTARSKHRATLRKYIHQVKTEATELPPAGTPVLWDEKEVGEMRSSQGGIGLALLRIEEVDKAGAQALTAGGIRLSAQLPDWLNPSEN